MFDLCQNTVTVTGEKTDTTKNTVHYSFLCYNEVHPSIPSLYQAWPNPDLALKSENLERSDLIRLPKVLWLCSIHPECTMQDLILGYIWRWSRSHVSGYIWDLCGGLHRYETWFALRNFLQQSLWLCAVVFRVLLCWYVLQGEHQGDKAVITYHVIISVTYITESSEKR